VTRVLVVDDDGQILRALRSNLTARGYEVLTATDGAGALRAAADGRPDVVVLALGLPDIDGSEVIAGLRGWTQVPIIACCPAEPTPATRWTPWTPARTTT
jgi:two-component system KDP operon response regulator KdpE